MHTDRFHHTKTLKIRFDMFSNLKNRTFQLENPKSLSLPFDHAPGAKPERNTLCESVCHWWSHQNHAYEIAMPIVLHTLRWCLLFSVLREMKFLFLGPVHTCEKNFTSVKSHTKLMIFHAGENESEIFWRKNAFHLKCVLNFTVKNFSIQFSPVKKISPVKSHTSAVKKKNICQGNFFHAGERKILWNFKFFFFQNFAKF